MCPHNQVLAAHRLQVPGRSECLERAILHPRLHMRGVTGGCQMTCPSGFCIG